MLSVRSLITRQSFLRTRAPQLSTTLSASDTRALLPLDSRVEYNKRGYSFQSHPHLLPPPTLRHGSLPSCPSASSSPRPPSPSPQQTRPALSPGPPQSTPAQSRARLEAACAGTFRRAWPDGTRPQSPAGPRCTRWPGPSPRSGLGRTLAHARGPFRARTCAWRGRRLRACFAGSSRSHRAGGCRERGGARVSSRAGGRMNGR